MQMCSHKIKLKLILKNWNDDVTSGTFHRTRLKDELLNLEKFNVLDLNDIWTKRSTYFLSLRQVVELRGESARRIPHLLTSRQADRAFKRVSP